MRLKIGLVTGEFPPMEGGVGAFTAELARAFHQDGHTVHIITSRQARRPSPSDGRGRRRSFASLGEPIKLPFAQLHPKIARWRWPSLSAVADIVLRYELDVVNLQYQPAAFNMNSAAINFLPWRLKTVTKTAVTFHDLRVPYLFPKAGRLRQAAVRFLAQSAGGIITTNPADYQALQALIEGGIVNSQGPAGQGEKLIAQIAIGSNITVYPTNHIEIEEIRHQLGLHPGDVLLGYFGFLNESKGADTLIEALAQLNSRFHLVFIGGQTGASDRSNNQAFLNDLQGQISHLGLDGRVHWTGFLKEERVSAYLQAVEIMVMPYRDGASLRRGTLMAALAHGRPLITTQPAEATAQLVPEENCVFVTPGAPADLAQVVERLATDARLQQKIGQGAALLADQFTWDKIAKKTAEFYRSL